MQSVAETWARIDGWAQQHHPSLLASLRRGASAQSLSAADISHPEDFSDRDVVAKSFLVWLEAATWAG